ncbi:MAG: BtrH N-terminal domain-containing protein [Natrialbaceae archaeon]|nr:BtrH N-terminal domain-containing protein [Natrialbaceae archaeon]
MAVRIEGIHRPGNHCGSTSLRTLSTHYGWDFDEPTCFGLAAGLGFAYFELPITPHRGFFGRPLWLETAFFENLGIAIDHREGDSWDEAWDHIRSEIDANNPVMVFADIYYLDYYGSDTHFSPHSLLCIGYEDDRAILADSEFETPQSLPLDRLHEAMTSAHVMPIDNRHLVVTDPSMTIPYEEAALEAITETASYMLEPTSTSRSLGPGTHGIQGIRRFAEDLPDWPSVEDPFWTVRFAYQNIERRGTGGGAFRRMYAAFLEKRGRAHRSSAGIGGNRDGSRRR